LPNLHVDKHEEDLSTMGERRKEEDGTKIDR
jgi:hypothetical protein